jgi:hypothetical protein
VLRSQYYKEIEQGHVTTQSKFNYGEYGYNTRSSFCTRRTSLVWSVHKFPLQEPQGRSIQSSTL